MCECVFKADHDFPKFKEIHYNGPLSGRQRREPLKFLSVLADMFKYTSGTDMNARGALLRQSRRKLHPTHALSSFIFASALQT